MYNKIDYLCPMSFQSNNIGLPVLCFVLPAELMNLLIWSIPQPEE